MLSSGEPLPAARRSARFAVSGPSVSGGYWQRDDATAETFVQRDGKRWLRTGDLGFLDNEQLFITGRRKDLIILRGHNVYPQDIEQAIESEVEVVRKGRVAAFAIPVPSGEGIGVAVEVPRNLQKLVPVDRLVEALSAAVSQVCGEPLAVAALLEPRGTTQDLERQGATLGLSRRLRSSEPRCLRVLRARALRAWRGCREINGTAC